MICARGDMRARAGEGRAPARAPRHRVAIEPAGMKGGARERGAMASRCACLHAAAGRVWSKNEGARRVGSQKEASLNTKTCSVLAPRGENAPEGMLEGAASACCKCLQAVVNCCERARVPQETVSRRERLQATTTCRKQPRAATTCRERRRIALRARPLPRAFARPERPVPPDAESLRNPVDPAAQRGILLQSFAEPRESL